MFEKVTRPKILNNLSKYKTNVIKEYENGIYRHPRFHTTKKLSYILPIMKKDGRFKNTKNILSGIRTDFLNSNYKNIKPHIYFNHLNSSQAMCINFFYPLIKNNLLGHILFKVKINEPIDYCEVKFEKESNIEKTGRKTNFDFYIKTKKSTNIFFEIKYTERSFGIAKNDNAHIRKFSADYFPKLNSVPHINKRYHSMDLFFKNYQIMRNILNIDENSYVVIIYLKENEKLRMKCEEVKKQIILKPFTSHFLDIDWHDMFKWTYDSINKNNKDLVRYYDDFYDKYLAYR
jgi:hypothetical protein